MNKKWPFKVSEVMEFLLSDETPYIATVRRSLTGEERAIGISMDDDEDVRSFCCVWYQLSRHSDKRSRHDGLLYSDEYYSITALLKSTSRLSATEDYTLTWLKHPMTLEELEKLRATND